MGIGEVSGLTRPLGKSWDKKDVPIKEVSEPVLFIISNFVDKNISRKRSVGNNMLPKITTLPCVN